MIEQNYDSELQNPLSLQKGKYVFIDHLQEVFKEGASVPFFSATAIMVIEKEGELIGDIQTVNISDLILKQSSYVDENGKTIEAHQLYTWPRNLGSTIEWSASKQEFLNQFVLNFPIEILSVQESNGITWKYITPENFKNTTGDIRGSVGFQDYADHKNDYFFLRRPLNTPK